jgi:Histidine kinase-, DNA gyrase B-, and HSP90-like ATPase
MLTKTPPPDFQQAKSSTTPCQFLQNVAKADRGAHRKSKARSEPKLTRVTFRVSRLMEFCTRRELQNQTGHSAHDWPLVVLKELMDNALDACEEAEAAPVISITVEPGSVTIQDNGGGIKPGTVKSILDYTIRVSSREAYVSPTRGAQGNALKTILAMAYVLDRDAGSDVEAAGVTLIETRGRKHRVEFRVDHINNQPKLTHTVTPSEIKRGTRITVEWPKSEGLLQYAEDEFKQLVQGYTWFNPHLTLRGVWYGCEFVNDSATNPNWDKWRPRNPTSPHWYDESRLQRYRFGPLWRAVNLANRYDLLIISTKGVSVVAARKLFDALCGIADSRGIPLVLKPQSKTDMVDSLRKLIAPGVTAQCAADFERIKIKIAERQQAAGKIRGNGERVRGESNQGPQEPEKTSSRDSQREP